MAKVFGPLLAALGSVDVPFTLAGGPDREPTLPVVNSPAAMAPFTHDRSFGFSDSSLAADGPGWKPSASNTHVDAGCDRCASSWRPAGGLHTPASASPPSSFQVRSIRFFYVGDIPLLAEWLGFSGPSSGHGCNICRAVTHSLRGVEHHWSSVYVEYGDVPRTLANLAADARHAKPIPRAKQTPSFTAIRSIHRSLPRRSRRTLCRHRCMSSWG